MVSNLVIPSLMNKAKQSQAKPRKEKERKDMFTFKYRPDPMACEHKVECNGAFQRLGYCNAYYEHKHSVSFSNALQHEIETDKYMLWSYESAIIEVRVNRDYTDRHMNVCVTLNEDVWRTSNSTIRHCSRFLQYITNKYDFGYGLTYHNLKHIMASTRMHFFFDDREWIECYSHGWNTDVLMMVHRKNASEFESYVVEKGYEIPHVTVRY